jgi:hypothetical protein
MSKKPYTSTLPVSKRIVDGNKHIKKTRNSLSNFLIGLVYAFVLEEFNDHQICKREKQYVNHYNNKELNTQNQNSICQTGIRSIVGGNPLVEN